jgi:hypothetical protein
LDISLQPELLEMSMVSATGPEPVELDASRRRVVTEFYGHDFTAFGYAHADL